MGLSAVRGGQKGGLEARLSRPNPLSDPRPRPPIRARYPVGGSPGIRIGRAGARTYGRFNGLSRALGKDR